MLELRARHDRVILKSISFEDTMVGDIIIPDNGGEKADYFEVVSVGPGLLNPYTNIFTPTQFQVGEKVFVKKAFIHSIDVEGQEYFVTRDADILGYTFNEE